MLAINEKLKNDLESIFDHYGITSQYTKTMEELGELIKAMATGTEEDVVTEIADVLIMIEQLIQGTGIKDKVNAEIIFKISRQMHRIKAQEDRSTASMFDCFSRPAEEME